MAIDVGRHTYQPEGVLNELGTALDSNGKSYKLPEKVETIVAKEIKNVGNELTALNPKKPLIERFKIFAGLEKPKTINKNDYSTRARRSAYNMLVMLKSIDASDRIDQAEENEDFGLLKLSSSGREFVENMYPQMMDFVQLHAQNKEVFSEDVVRELKRLADPQAAKRLVDKVMEEKAFEEKLHRISEILDSL